MTKITPPPFLDEPKSFTAWFNYVLNDYEYLTEAPKSYEAYIPQIAPAQGLYQVLLKIGKTPLEAAVEVLEACVKPD